VCANQARGPLGDTLISHSLEVSGPGLTGLLDAPHKVVAMTRHLPPILLTGGPAVGKTATARSLAETTRRTACLDVDDIRQLVKNGAAAPWDGAEGLAQQLLGVQNAAALTTNFTAAGFNVALTDVVNPTTLLEYRRLIPEVFVIRLRVSPEEAWRRARSRMVYLTDAEFETLHREQAEPLAVNDEVDVTHLDAVKQAELVRALWTQHR
jgi:predicted kinase